MDGVKSFDESVGAVRTFLKKILLWGLELGAPSVSTDDILDPLGLEQLRTVAVTLLQWLR